MWIHFQFPTKKQKREGISLIHLLLRIIFFLFLFWTYGKKHCIQFIDLSIFTEKIIEPTPVLSFKHFFLISFFFFWGGGEVISVLCSLQLTLVEKCRQVLNNLENFGQIETCFNMFMQTCFNKVMQTCFNKFRHFYKDFEIRELFQFWVFCIVFSTVVSLFSIPFSFDFFDWFAFLVFT